MKAVVINMDDQKARYKSISRLLESFDIDFTRFPACTFDSIPERIRPFLLTPAGKKRNPDMRPGEIGCYASHLEVMYRVLEGDYPSPLLILEDDAYFPPESVTLIKKLYDSLLTNSFPNEKKVDFINLYTKGVLVPIDSITTSFGIKIIRNFIPSSCMHAYLITRKGCEKFISFRPRRIAHVDKDIKFAAWIHDMGVWEVTRALAYQDTSFESSAPGDRSKRFPKHRHERKFASHYYGYRYLLFI